MGHQFTTAPRYFDKHECKIQDAVSADKYAAGSEVDMLVTCMVHGLAANQKEELLIFCRNVVDIFSKKKQLADGREISTTILLKSLDKSDLVRRGTVATKDESGSSKKKLKTETTEGVLEEHFAVSDDDLKSMLDDTENKLSELETIRKGLMSEVDRRHNKARQIVAAAILKKYT